MTAKNPNPTTDAKNFEKRCFEALEQFSKKLDAYPWENPAFYNNWLAQTYYYVCHSTRLLTRAASRFGMDQDPLHQRFIKHSNEEKRHEMYALKDLKEAGHTLADYPELSETMAFYQSQYYWIDMVNPASFFGGILALEGISVIKGKALLDRVKPHYPKSTAFLKAHSQEDVDHLTEALKMVEHTVSNYPGAAESIEKNLKMSVDLYLSMLNAAAAQAKADGGTGRKAA